MARPLDLERTPAYRQERRLLYSLLDAESERSRYFSRDGTDANISEGSNDGCQIEMSDCHW